MNDKLQAFARNEITEGLKLCTEQEKEFFKRLYKGKKIESTIDEIIEEIPAEKLDWAMQQVQRTLDKKLSPRHIKVFNMLKAQEKLNDKNNS